MHALKKNRREIRKADKLSLAELKNISGVVVWEGPSPIDGAPIVHILTGLNHLVSRNRKTGAQVQSFIMRSDVDPVTAVREGLDVSVCGNCKMRGHDGFKGRRCYVVMIQSPTTVFNAFKRGIYPYVSEKNLARLLRGRSLRMSAYGEPWMLPIDHVEKLEGMAGSHTGFIHGWKEADPAFSKYCMASCETMAEAEEARALGYKSFRVITPEDPTPAIRNTEATCPGSVEAGEVLQCLDCEACGGTTGKGRGSMTIRYHGSVPIMLSFERRAA